MDLIHVYYALLVAIGVICICLHVYATARFKRTDHTQFRWGYEIVSPTKFVAVVIGTLVIVFFVPTIRLDDNGPMQPALLLVIVGMYLWSVWSLYVSVNTRYVAWLTWQKDYPDRQESIFYYFALDERQQYQLMQRKESERSRALKRIFNEYKKTGVINIPDPDNGA
jgi:hypothetical protein